ncbi:MAG: phosphonoacetaldehyde reductase [Candidatus Paceibacterota bacterium]|jgi:alcohol dehydrogenase class IV
MKQTEYIGVGAISHLAEIVSELSPQKVFLVTGKGSYTTSGAAQPVANALAGIDVLHYTDFKELPLHEDIQKGIEVYTAYHPDLIIAVGGGHVMDMAKAINFFAGKKPLIAIPTTAGTGSEATQFAVVYKDGHKSSLEHEEIIPTFAIVDPHLAMSVPKDTALACALDALCQAIESLWSNKATDESRTYARQALEAIWGSIIPAIEEKNPAAITALCFGAHLSGKAINISKTTACHALSYGLTYRFGVPHGTAASIFLPGVWAYNNFSCPNPSITAETVKELLQRFGIKNLSQFGVTAADIPSLAAEVNVERLGNNPRAVSKEDVVQFYTEIL